MKSLYYERPPTKYPASLLGGGWSVGGGWSAGGHAVTENGGWNTSLQASFGPPPEASL